MKPSDLVVCLTWCLAVRPDDFWSFVRQFDKQICPDNAGITVNIPRLQLKPAYHSARMTDNDSSTCGPYSTISCRNFEVHDHPLHKIRQLTGTSPFRSTRMDNGGRHSPDEFATAHHHNTSVEIICTCPVCSGLSAWPAPPFGCGMWKGSRTAVDARCLI
jgi:hypothetical protein